MKVAGVSFGEHLYPRLGRVDPALERLELLLAVGVANQQLAVEHVAALREAQLGEVPAHRLAVSRLHEHLVAVDEHDRAKAVPLAFEQPAVPIGKLCRRPSQRWPERR